MRMLVAVPDDDDFEPDAADRDTGREDADERDSDDEDDDSDDDADDADSDDGGKERAKAPVKPDGKPYTQADVDKLARSLRAARRNARQKDSGTDGKGADGKGGADGAAGEPDAAVVEARAADVAAATWKPLFVHQAARTALVEAGLIGKPDRLLKLLDTEDIDVDPESGEIDGLDEQIADLKREYKHLFRRSGARRLDASRDRDGNDSRRGKMTATELQALQLTGRA